VAEETGLISPIGGWALLEACCQSMVWQRAGLLPGKVAVNVSARQLADPGFVDFVRHALSETGLSPEMLELELTETALMEYMDESLSRLHQLRNMGITMAIDDFGTGYSSLSYLQKLPVSSVKIDQSFVQEITEGSTGAIPVIQAIVDMAHGMGLHVVAEGVETELQLHALRVVGCDSLQGYLIGRPSPASEIRDILATASGSLLRLDGQIRAAEDRPRVSKETQLQYR
jgi:EAL domain-containing protein (putative c-di-GMP-specific phosphodiesterase class I)